MKTTLLLIFFFHSFWFQQPVKPNANNTFVQTLEGKETKFVLSPQHNATVLFFLSPQCPLCQSYSLTINNLTQKFVSKKVRFVGIIPGINFSRDEVAFYKNKYKLNLLEFYFDKNLNLTHKLGASITPEVFVFNKKSNLIYQGRIDNWAYELGKKRTVITSHDLMNVLENVVNDKDVVFYKTKAIGCYIE